LYRTGIFEETYVYPFVRVAVPADSCTITFTVSGKCTGVTHVISVRETTTTSVAATPPKDTITPDVKFVPVIVTEAPPEDGPLFDTMLVIVGTGFGV
jgi:hypothetical protein